MSEEPGYPADTSYFPLYVTHSRLRARAMVTALLEQARNAGSWALNHRPEHSWVSVAEYDAHGRHCVQVLNFEKMPPAACAEVLAICEGFKAGMNYGIVLRFKRIKRMGRRTETAEGQSKN